MDEQKIYNDLINRGKNRMPFISNHRHRIIPGYEGGKYISENISYLTRQEHRIVHFMRWKLYKKNADKTAYTYLGGKNPNNAGSNNGMFGKIHSEKTLEKMRGSKSEETKKKMSQARKGKYLGDENVSKRPEVREKIRLSKLGNKSCLGKQHSEERKEKQRQYKLAYWAARKQVVNG